MSINYLPRSYDDFGPAVADIKAGTTTADFLGKGAESAVWRVPLNDSLYAVKIANEVNSRGRKRDTLRATQAKIAVGQKGLGISGLEQVQAGSPEEGVVIYEYVDGVKLSAISDEASDRITRKHIESLWKTVRAATQAGIEFDGWNSSGDNAFFSQETGFTLIDYWQAGPNLQFENNWLYAVRSLGSVGLKILDVNVHF